LGGAGRAISEFGATVGQPGALRSLTASDNNLGEKKVLGRKREG
jgi:hypothetical protein